MENANKKVTKFKIAEVAFASSNPSVNLRDSAEPSGALASPLKILTATPVL